MLPRRALALLLLPWRPAAAAIEPEQHANITEALDLAAAFLCVTCDSEVDADAAHLPMRRALLATAALSNARAAIEQAMAMGFEDYGAVLVPVLEALVALERVDEAAALEAIRDAEAALANVLP